jgi:glycosyltransferase involved in cell wall biosynthesis
MKILMIAPEPFFEPRGTPFSVYQRLYALSQLGHQVDVVTYHVGQDIELPHVTLHRIPALINVKEIKIGPSLVKPFLDLLLFFTALALMLRNKYDVIHSHEEAAFFALVLSKLFRVSHIYDMHSSLPQQLANSKFGWRPFVRIFALFERWVIHTCDSIITIGQDLETIVREINPHVPLVTIENLPLHANGMTTRPEVLHDLRGQLQAYGRQTIIYTGTFEAYQGLGLLLESAQLVIQDHPQACFILVGGKPQQIEQWQQTAQKLHISDHVRFTGIVSPQEAVTYLDLADLLVSPRTGGTSVPLKIYSYLYAGKPIVATRLPAHTQVLNPENALLVEPTAAAFAAGILQLLQDPHQKEWLGKQAYEHAIQNYSLANYLDKLERVYPRPNNANTPIPTPNTLSGDLHPYGERSAHNPV